ncbi:hypothetical protein M0Q50_04085 [bacterium]|jgi:hypothetical protein|nr:hypothetical protein [bacterium]
MDLENYKLDELFELREQLDLEELHEILLEQFKIVEKRHLKFIEKGNKTAEAEVRRALGRIKILIPEYRRKSVKATDSYMNPSKYD